MDIAITDTTTPILAAIAAPTPAITKPALAFVANSRAENTRRAYRADWADFTTWCRDRGRDPLPATPETVADYLADLATDRKPATISRRVAAIASAHRLAGQPSPTRDELVRLALRGIQRTLGTAQAQARPILLSDLVAMVHELDDDLAGLRDRAVLLVGWAGAFRRSELVALEVSDIERTSDGLVVTIRRSKTDQTGIGRQVGIPRGTTLDPVAALDKWLDAAGIIEGPLFRPVDRHGNVGLRALDPAAVAAIVKRAAERAGLDPSGLSGHSLRAGLLTTAAMNGADPLVLMQQSGHKSATMVARYVRRADLFRQNAATLAGM
jgi:integrase